QREVAVARGGTVYLAGGLNGAGTSVNGVFALDPRTGRVQRVGPFPQPFHDGPAAMIVDRLVEFGGGPVPRPLEELVFGLARDAACVASGGPAHAARSRGRGGA